MERPLLPQHVSEKKGVHVCNAELAAEAAGKLHNGMRHRRPRTTPRTRCPFMMILRAMCKNVCRFLVQRSLFASS